MAVKVPLTIMHLLKVVIKLSFPPCKIFRPLQEDRKNVLPPAERQKWTNFLPTNLMMALLLYTILFFMMFRRQQHWWWINSRKSIIKNSPQTERTHFVSSLEPSEIWAGCKENILSLNFVTRALRCSDKYLRKFEWIKSALVEKNYRLVCGMGICL